MRTITLDPRQQRRADLLARLAAGALSPGDAAGLLGVGERHARRPSDAPVEDRPLGRVLVGALVEGVATQARHAEELVAEVLVAGQGDEEDLVQLRLRPKQTGQDLPDRRAAFGDRRVGLGVERLGHLGRAQRRMAQEHRRRGEIGEPPADGHRVEEEVVGHWATARRRSRSSWAPCASARSAES
jgi:hypothetical protein